MNYRDSFEENHMKKIRIWISSAHCVRKSIKNLIKKERKRIKGEEGAISSAYIARRSLRRKKKSIRK